MRSTQLLRAACACLALVASGAHAAASLPGPLQSQVRKATFEIVMQKPELDSLSYEKPLPLELLPFSERNDKYVSVGSAFAIGNNRFVTAAHVLERGFLSEFGEPAVRQADGSVHPISHILKYSMLQDFVVFSCDSCTTSAVLKPNRDPTLDSEVFAVGNALGEGIVIRDGLLTSITPETRYGKWKWLRFSAAASPGNSGGPLLDSQARVIGVVLRKSESENLNYALPVSELLDAPEQTAQLNTEMRFGLPFLNEMVSGHRESTFALPKTYSEVAAQHARFYATFMDDLSQELLAKNADTLFPNGAGAAQLLYVNAPTDTLGVITQKEDSTWDAYIGEKPQSAQLADNGYAVITTFKNLALIKIRRPDSADAAQFYNDSAAYMDTLLKLFPWKRMIGREEVRVTSMGKAKIDSMFTDVYGRKWQLRSWNGEFQDRTVTSLALPTPEGYVGILRFSSTAGQHDAQIDLRETSNFAHISYSGTLKQWQEYLALTNLLPRTLSDARVTFEYGKQFEFRAPRFAFTYTQAQQKVLPESQLMLTMNYVQNKAGFSWDVTGLTAIEDLAGDGVIVVNRRPPPAPTLPQAYSVDWQKLLTKQQPYSGKVEHEGGASSITAIYPYPANGKPASDSSVIYTLLRARTGEFKDKQMQTELKQISKGLQVLE